MPDEHPRDASRVRFTLVALLGCGCLLLAALGARHFWASEAVVGLGGVGFALILLGTSRALPWS